MGAESDAEHALLGLRAEPGELAELLPLGGRAQLLLGGDPELGEEAPRGLGPEAGNTHHVDEPGRNAVAELRERLEVAGLRQLDDLRFDRAADPRDLRRAAVERELGDRGGRLPHPRGGAPVGGEPESVGPVELEQIGQELEPVGELGVRGNSPCGR